MSNYSYLGYYPCYPRRSYYSTISQENGTNHLQTPHEPGVYAYTNSAFNESNKSKAVSPTTAKLEQGDENVERGNWSGKLDFLLSCIGYAVGLGNVWRFPYMCYRNGGGAFLIPYTIFLVFVGMPIFLFDLALGQFGSNGPLTCWEFAPMFTGLGYAMTVISFYVTIYYNVIIAYTVYYAFASMASPLPWDGCHHSWNTPDCVDRLPLLKNCSLPYIKKSNGQCMFGTEFKGLWNDTIFTNATGRKRELAAQEYFNNEVLGLTDGIWDLGTVQWKLLLCLLASWVLVFLCMIRGIKSSGKVVYFTATFPYVVLLILFFRGVTLPGAGKGIYFYIVPQIHKLGEAQVWQDAANQIFFSLSASWGGLITLSSYNKFHTNCIRDTLIVTLTNCGTSVFAGFVIFSFLGYMAGEMQVDVSNVADKGLGLAFVVYPEALKTMPISTLWAILFFIMLLTLGLDSQFTMLETVVTSIMDKYPQKFRNRKTILIALLSLVLFILGIPLVTRGGPYIFQLMDTYCGGWAILMIGLFEALAVGWVYGRPGFRGSCRFLKDIEIMTKKKPSFWWQFTWQYSAPLLILLILVYSWVDYKPAEYDGKPYPEWADAMGWMMTLSAILCIPGFMIYKMYQEREGSILERLSNISVPSYKWGPALPKHRKLVAEYLEDPSDFYIDPVRRIRYLDHLEMEVKYTSDSTTNFTTPVAPPSLPRTTANHTGPISNVSAYSNPNTRSPQVRTDKLPSFSQESSI